MKLTLIFLFLFALSINGNAQKYSKPQRTVISGQVFNTDFGEKIKTIKLSISQLGLPVKQVSSKLDAQGNFKLSFLIYTQADCWLSCKNSFMVLIHPGDSLHVKFDSAIYFLDGIQFSGDAADTNSGIRDFQYLYFSNVDYYNPLGRERAMKEYDLVQYKLYLDSIRVKNKKSYDRFLKWKKFNEETKAWALYFLEEDYYNALSLYPDQHRKANNLTKKEWDVPLTYYDELKKRLPITESMFICSDALSQYIANYHYNYVKKKVWAEEANQKYITEKGNIAPRHVMDSLAVYGILKHTQDNLLRQMELLDLFSREFQSLQVEHFEAYRDVFDAYVKEPYLREPFLELYAQTKEKIKQKH